MNDKIALKEALKQLTESLPREAAPQSEQRLRQAFRNRRRRARVSLFLAAAASLLLVLSAAWVVRHRTPAPRPQPISAANRFVLLPYGQSDVPLEHGVIVRVQVQSGAGPVEADLLVGQDGIARAVRFTE